jgi:hypothetical protein
MLLLCVISIPFHPDECTSTLVKYNKKNWNFKAHASFTQGSGVL